MKRASRLFQDGLMRSPRRYVPLVPSNCFQIGRSPAGPRRRPQWRRIAVGQELTQKRRRAFRNVHTTACRYCMNWSDTPHRDRGRTGCERCVHRAGDREDSLGRYWKTSAHTGRAGPCFTRMLLVHWWAMARRFSDQSG